MWNSDDYVVENGQGYKFDRWLEDRDRFCCKRPIIEDPPKTFVVEQQSEIIMMEHVPGLKISKNCDVLTPCSVNPTKKKSRMMKRLKKWFTTKFFA